MTWKSHQRGALGEQRVGGWRAIDPEKSVAKLKYWVDGLHLDVGCRATKASADQPNSSKRQQQTAASRRAKVRDYRSEYAATGAATPCTVYQSGYLQFANLTYQGEHLAAYAGESVILRDNPHDIPTSFIYQLLS